MALAKSNRIGPSGEDQIIEPPAEVRTVPPSPPTLTQLLWVKFSAGNWLPVPTGVSPGIQTVPGAKAPAATAKGTSWAWRAVKGNTVRPLKPKSEPASKKTAPLRPRSLGTP